MSLTFNSVTFKSPATIVEVPKIVNKSEWRSINNTLTTDILDFTAKKEFILSWIILTEAQFNTLVGYVDSGQIPVVSTITGHSFNFTLASVSFTGDVTHTFDGNKSNVEVLIRQA